MGNSEVGHLNIGAGRVVMQELPRISQAIESHEIERAPALRGLIEKLKETGGTCHLMGLVSPGGVHSHQDHAAALAHILAQAGVPTVLHAFTDGRDTPPRSAKDYLQRLTGALPPSVAIATVCGRYYAMDRDKRWDRVAKAYAAIVAAQGPRFETADAVIADAYAHDTSDEFVVPAAVGGYRGMRDGDGVLCFNFRADRVREILSAILDPDFKGFAREARVRASVAVGMTQYSDELNAVMHAIFPPQTLPNILGEVVARAGRTQLRMAETEKYAHVTYFLNGGEEAEYPGEDRTLVPSPKVATYDLKPEMSAPELTDKAVDAIDSGTYDLIVLNFANPDMVGFYTGSLAAAIKAVETVDAGLGQIADAPVEQGGRRALGDRRPRQLRADARSADRRPAYRPHDQSGAGDPDGRRRRAAVGGAARRSRADAARADGLAGPRADDRLLLDAEGRGRDVSRRQRPRHPRLGGGPPALLPD